MSERPLTQEERTEIEQLTKDCYDLISKSEEVIVRSRKYTWTDAYEIKYHFNGLITDLEDALLMGDIDDEEIKKRLEIYATRHQGEEKKSGDVLDGDYTVTVVALPKVPGDKASTT